MRALAELAGHTIMLAGALVGMKVTEVLIEMLWGHSAKLFGAVPLEYVFHLGDLAMIVMFY